MIYFDELYVSEKLKADEKKIINDTYEVLVNVLNDYLKEFADIYKLERYTGSKSDPTDDDDDEAQPAGHPVFGFEILFHNDWSQDQ